MGAAFPIILDFPSEEATASFAARLAPRLRPGDTLLLSGPIGAGKTHFARALIKARLQAAGRDEDVPSPTFTLVQTYDDGAAEIWHADLYRLTHPAETVELGLDDAFRSAIVLVEWPDRLGGLAPAGALWLAFADGTDDTSRRVTVTSADARWSGVLPAHRAAHA
jgi:tRNA threonylcarbamoyladenosine biosynthesis protein TsaE